ncbi:mobilization protein [Collinsella sp. AM17-1]|uniref:plasmid mobilization protein n=1 Tax=Collinsella sp. AM17-1 TaxID=2292027 RepID=UPI000E53D7B2|nr:mobilization protein [Collinsella sp. AM17-1]RHH73533.1 mobilization protein [Collinsella sp. AM17-1]
MPCPNERRKRSMTIAFRVSPEENELVNLLAATAHMTKQDYIMSKLTDTAIVVRPNSRTYRALKDAMAKVYAELSRIRRAGDMDESLVQRVELLMDIFHELGEEIPESQIDAEAAMIEGMRRR